MSTWTNQFQAHVNQRANIPIISARILVNLRINRASRFLRQLNDANGLSKIAPEMFQANEKDRLHRSKHVLNSIVWSVTTPDT